jgi:hypothetical protein
MDPNIQNPVSPVVPTSDPNTGIPASVPEPTMPTPPPAMPAEPVASVPEPVVPAEGTGEVGGGMPPTTPPAAI